MNKRISPCVLLLCVVSAYSQSPDSALVGRSFLLDEMVVSASRWEQNLREVPNTLSTLSHNEIDFANVQTTADVLSITPGVFVQKSQLAGGSPMIRGFATNRVLIVIDGVRMNNAIFRSGNVQNVISLDANAIENAEVLFGPGSVLYGSDAIGGVMDFHTLRPTVNPSRGVGVSGLGMVRYSSANNERTGHGHVSLKGNRWGLITSATVADYDDLRMGSHGPLRYTRSFYVVQEDGGDVIRFNDDPDVQVPSGYSQFNLMQKVAFTPTTNWELNYAFYYGKTSRYARYDRLLLADDGGLPTNAEWYYGPQQWTMHRIAALYNGDRKLWDNLRIIAAYQGFGESRHNRAFGSTRRTNRFEKVYAFTLNADADKKATERITLYYGGEFVFNRVGSSAYREDLNTGAITGVSTRYPDDSRWRSAALYGSAKYRLSESWLLQASGRLNHVSSHANFDTTYFDFPFTDAQLRHTAMNGSAGSIYYPRKNWKLYANLSTGFRAPNIDDIGKVFDSEPGNVVVPNRELKPERALGVEAGSVSPLGKRITLNLSAFYTLLDNAIARGVSSFNGKDSIPYDGVLSRVLSQQNINRIDVYGVQAVLQWKMINNLSLTSNFSWQRGKEEDADGVTFSPTHVAPVFGSAHLVYTPARWMIDLSTNYNGTITYEDLPPSERADEHLYALDETGNPYAPGWWTLNIKFEATITNRMKFSAGIENLLDKRYRPYSSGISAPGRNVIASVRYTF